MSVKFKFLSETLLSEENQLQHIEEQTGATKKTKIKGVFLQDTIINGNKRLYPKEVMREAVEDYDKKYISKNRAVGELGHPNGPKLNPTLISHKITKLYEDGTNWFGEAEVLDTPNGKIVKALLESGVTLGTSSRGLGDFKKNSRGYDEILPGFRFSTAGDIVFDPSAPDAFVKGVLENVEYYLDESSNEWVETNIRKSLKNKNKRQIEESKLMLFELFLNHLSNR